MILKSIKVEHKDEKTGLVLKRIITSDGEYLNHKIAIDNSMCNCEKHRLCYGKNIFDNPFQTHHIPFNNKKMIWDFDGMQISREHAKRQNRIYLTFQQRSEEQWQSLTFPEAEGDFQDLATRGLSFVPYSIPLDAKLEDWIKRRGEAVLLLNNSQILVPVFCSKHQRELFEEIFNYEFEHSKIIGVQCYGLYDEVTLLNLMKIRLRNMKLESKDECPLLFGLNYQKILKSFANVSGSFAYSCFGFDILSCRQMFLEKMPPEVVQHILSTKPEEMMRYDRNLGGFSLSAEQEFDNGINLTKQFLLNVDLTEGLNPHQAIQWANHNGQQKDFDVLNDYLLETAYEGKEDLALKYIGSEKERWAVFWKTKMIQTAEVS